MQFTFEELVIINNAINESLEAIDKQEYQTRLGGSPEDALKLMKKVQDLLDQTKGTPTV
ncbi:MAG: hypothetical protein RDU25_03960 [Patescibacteria group bacterium]|nr:hypothetical protein [Patescibacteria group bacterium]